MPINGVKAWFKDKFRSHAASKIARVGELALRTKIILFATGAYLLIAVLGGFVIMASTAISVPAHAISSFLDLVNPFDDEDTPATAESDSEQPQCLEGKADPAFSEVVTNVPEGTPLDVTTGWLLYSAPQATTSSSRARGNQRDTSDRMDIDEFELAWSQVITGTYTGPTQERTRSRTDSRTTSRQANEQPTTILEVVETIDPATNDYADYVDQASMGAMYLLLDGTIEAPSDEVKGDLIGGMAQFCAEGGTIPTPALSTVSGG